MSTAYALITWSGCFSSTIYLFRFFTVSLRLEKMKMSRNCCQKKISPFRWKDLIDPKNKKIGLIDLGNHILIAGVVLIGIFIISNA